MVREHTLARAEKPLLPKHRKIQPSVWPGLPLFIHLRDRCWVNKAGCSALQLVNPVRRLQKSQ